MIVNTKITKHMLVPDVGAVTREMTSSSQIGMILRRVKKLSFAAFITLGLNNIISIPRLAKKDFATGITLLAELEILASLVKRPCWVLHNQMTDMAIALGNTHLLRLFFQLAGRYSFLPGILTYNPERCIQFLSKMQGVPKNLIVFCPKTSKAFESFAKATHVNIRFLEGTL